MELHDIAKLVYEVTRVKEDRLLMKWEDDRARLYGEVLALRAANQNALEVIEQQQEEYNNLARTISNFGKKSSPPRTQSLSAVSSKKPAASNLVADDDGFLSIDRNKAKKGPLHTYFQQPTLSKSAPTVKSQRSGAKKASIANPGNADLRQDTGWLTPPEPPQEIRNGNEDQELVTQAYMPSDNPIDSTVPAKSTSGVTAQKEPELSIHATVPRLSAPTDTVNRDQNGGVGDQFVSRAAPDHYASTTRGTTSTSLDEEATCAGENDVSLLINPDMGDSQMTCASQQPPSQPRPPSLFAVADSRRNSAASHLAAMGAGPDAWPPSPSQTQSPMPSQEHYIGALPENHSPASTRAATTAGQDPVYTYTHASDGGSAYPLADHGPDYVASRRVSLAEVIDLSNSPQKAPRLSTGGLKSVHFAGTKLFSPLTTSKPRGTGAMLGAETDANAYLCDATEAERSGSNRARHSVGQVDRAKGNKDSGTESRKRTSDGVSRSDAVAASSSSRAALSPRKIRGSAAASSIQGIHSAASDAARSGGAERSLGENAVPNIPLALSCGTTGGRSSTSGRVKNGKGHGGTDAAGRAEETSVPLSGKHGTLSSGSNGKGAGAGPGSANGIGNSSSSRGNSRGGANDNAAAEGRTSAPVPVPAPAPAPAVAPAVAAAPLCKPTSKSIETVRGKADRAALPGFTCEECERFYRTMQEQGIYNLDDTQVRRDILQRCSRHKARYTPPSTPDGFWGLTLNTPDDWR